MITEEQISNLHCDIDVWYDDYLKNDAANDQNEWYSQLKGVLDAAYGEEDSEDDYGSRCSKKDCVHWWSMCSAQRCGECLAEDFKHFKIDD